jgi:hypothetical protein
MLYIINYLIECSGDFPSTTIAKFSHGDSMLAMEDPIGFTAFVRAVLRSGLMHKVCWFHMHLYHHSQRPRRRVAIDHVEVAAGQLRQSGNLGKKARTAVCTPYARTH